MLIEASVEGVTGVEPPEEPPPQPAAAKHVITSKKTNNFREKKRRGNKTSRNLSAIEPIDVFPSEGNLSASASFAYRLFARRPTRMRKHHPPAAKSLGPCFRNSSQSITASGGPAQKFRSRSSGVDAEISC
jgi:hypothetical protein